LFISKCNKGQTALNEIVLLRQIIKYLIKNKFGKIDILLKTKDISVINYFKNNLNEDLINIIPKKNNYSLIQKYENIIFTDSTLGYECLAKGKKIISFGLGSLDKKWCIQNGFQPINKFGYPAKFNDNGFCWSNKSSEKDINVLLKNILFMKQSTFNKKIKKLKERIICHDPKNSKFRRFLCVV
jgi:surface carbohydrate biosynthesis protein